jgi:hypothetical protein
MPAERPPQGAVAQAIGQAINDAIQEETEGEGLRAGYGKRYSGAQEQVVAESHSKRRAGARRGSQRLRYDALGADLYGDA